MTWQRSVQAAVRALKKEELSLEKQLVAVRQRIADLDDMGRTNGAAPSKRASPRRLSSEGRDAISRAAKKRWARYRAEKRASERKRRARS